MRPTEIWGTMEIQATKENLREHAAAPVAQWLIYAALQRTSVTYNEAKRRLETEFGFSTVFSPMMGIPAGALMDRILEVEDDCPLLNVLLVRQRDGMPGDGAGLYMAKYLNQRSLAQPGYRKRQPAHWRAAFDEICSGVYAFPDWDRVYADAFGHRLPAFASSQGTERDGIESTRGGEGRNHRKLRLWIRDNPGQVRRNYANLRTDTEVVLASEDRVDVVYYGPTTVALEVKSLDSDYADLRRGIFQCIKYRAVMQAMDARSNPQVIPFLVTQTRLPNDLASLARRHNIAHFIAPENLS